MATDITKMAATRGRIRVVVRTRPSAEFANHLIEFPTNGKVLLFELFARKVCSLSMLKLCWFGGLAASDSRHYVEVYMVRVSLAFA